MERRRDVSRLHWLRIKRASSKSSPQMSTSLQVTLDDRNGPTESQDVHLASPGIVTFSLAATEVSGSVPVPKPVEDPTPPSTARFAMGTLLVIAAVSAVTISLGWLDWPFLPADVRNRQGIWKNGSGDARHYKNAVARLNVGNDSIAGAVGLVRVSTAGGRTPTAFSPPEQYTLDDDSDSTQTFSEVDERDTTVSADGLNSDSTRDIGLMWGPPASPQRGRNHLKT